MPFLFTCPHCYAKTQVEDRYSGMTGECVTCGNEIQIPKFAPTLRPPPPEKSKPVLTWIVGTGVILVLLGCLGFAIFQFGGETVQRLTTNRSQSNSLRNLEKIANALNAYAAEYGSYPPPASKDAAGKPLLSWRVHILPFLGEDELFAKFDLTQDWTSTTNMQAAYEMPNAYRHPDSDAFYTPESNYYLIVGKTTLFPPSGPVNHETIMDSPSQTILVIEGKPPTTTSLWTEPVDIEFAKMSGQINGSKKHDPGQLMETGAGMATMDGRAHFLKNDTPVTTFNALVTPDGGEPLADDTLD